MSPIWRIPAEGGAEAQVVPLTHAFNFSATPRGLLFSRDEREIDFLDFASGRTSLIYRTPQILHVGIYLSPDGKHLLFSQKMDMRAEAMDSDLMLVEGFSEDR
jgi:hypothetical protein